MTQDEWIANNTFYCKTHNSRMSHATCQAMAKKANAQANGQIKTRFGLRVAHNLFTEKCLNCTQTERMQMQLVKKTCKACQQELPVDQFEKHNTSKDGYVATCNACRHKNKASDEKYQPPGKNTANNGHVIVLDFRHYPEVYEHIKSVAVEEFRSPEMQAMAWIVSHVRTIRGEAI